MLPINKESLNRRDFIKNTALTASGVALASSIIPIFHAAAEGAQQPLNWFTNIYRLLHLDAHFGGFKEIYKNFNAESAAQIIKDSGFQMVSFMAEDGPSYYPTKIGKMHSGLNRDFVGEFTKALKKRGIKVVVYYGLGEGCLNSPYTDQVVIPQMKEILSLYDVDGFFPDGVFQPYMMKVCRCEYCRELFAKEVGGEIPESDKDLKAFAYRKWANKHMEAHMEKVYRALSPIKPDVAILNNHLWVSRYPVTPPAYVQHICWDTPTPKHGLYSWNFSFEARYLSTITDILPDVTWSCMNTRGKDWLEYTLREPEAFLQECAILLAACGRTYLSDIPYPSGNPDPAVMDVFNSVNKRTLSLEPFVKDCKPVKEVAVLHSADSVWSKAPMIPHAAWTPSPAYHSVAGAHKALIEGHVQMGIINSQVFNDTSQNYRALVLPDQRILNERECEAVRNFVNNGGALLVTGETATRSADNKLLNNFSIADVLGLDFLNVSDTVNCYLKVKIKNERYGIPAMDVQVMGNYVRVRTTTAKTIFELVPPYEGLKTGTPPPAEFTEGPGITINYYGKGKVIYCAAKLFDAYYQESTAVLRKFILYMFDQVYPAESRQIILENTPINVEVFYNQRGTKRYIHLINYSGDKREVGIPQAQDFPIVHDIKVKIRLENKPSSIELVPDGKNIVFEYKNGYLEFTAEPLKIHDVYQVVI